MAPDAEPKGWRLTRSIRDASRVEVAVSPLEKLCLESSKCTSDFQIHLLSGVDLLRLLANVRIQRGGVGGKSSQSPKKDSSGSGTMHLRTNNLMFTKKHNKTCMDIFQTRRRTSCMRLIISSRISSVSLNRNIHIVLRERIDDTTLTVCKVFQQVFSNHYSTQLPPGTTGRYVVAFFNRLCKLFSPPPEIRTE